MMRRKKKSTSQTSMDDTMSHPAKRKQIRTQAAKAIIESGECFFKKMLCLLDYDCDDCNVPDSIPNSDGHRKRLALKKARAIKKAAGVSPPKHAKTT